MARTKAPDASGQPAEAVEAAAEPKYIVQSDLLHDGTPCIPGDTVPGSMFTGAQIDHLTACGTLVPLA